MHRRTNDVNLSALRIECLAAADLRQLLEAVTRALWKMEGVNARTPCDKCGRYSFRWPK